MKLFGIPIDNYTKEQAVCTIADAISSNCTKSLVFINAETIVRALCDPPFSKVLMQASLRFADGVGMQWAARRAGTPLVDNVNGTDLFPMLAEVLAKQGASVYLLGGKHDVVREVARRLSRQYRGLLVVGYHHGYWEEQELEAILADIRTREPDVLLVALGTPAQEEFVVRHMGDLSTKVVIAVGGLFDFYSGKIKRAPVFVRTLGLEWLWRLLLQPWRIKRQSALLKFISYVLVRGAS